MKQQDHPAVAAFKTRVDRAEESLKASGYTVKRNHLMDALARAEGERDWKHYKAKLESAATTNLVAPTKFGAPDLKGGVVHLIVQANTYHDDDCYAYVKVDQKVADYISALTAEHIVQVASQGSCAYTSGSLDVYWFTESAALQDKAELAMSVMDVSINCSRDGGYWDLTRTWDMDPQELIDMIKETIRLGCNYSFDVQNENDARQALQNVVKWSEYADLKAINIL